MIKRLIILFLLVSNILTAQTYNIDDFKKLLKFSTFYAAVNGGTSLSDVDVFSVDNVDYPKTNWIGDILDWDYRINEMQVGELEEEYVPSFIWASPPCTSFSVASIGRHWVKGHTFLPKTEQAELGVKIFEKTLEIIKYYLELNPDLVWFIENPRGKMRKAPHWETIPHTRHTVMY